MVVLKVAAVVGGIIRIIKGRPSDLSLAAGPGFMLDPVKIVPDCGIITVPTGRALIW